MHENQSNSNYKYITFILTWAGLTILMSMYIMIPLTATWISEFSINENKAIFSY